MSCRDVLLCRCLSNRFGRFALLKDGIRRVVPEQCEQACHMNMSRLRLPIKQRPCGLYVLLVLRVVVSLVYPAAINAAEAADLMIAGGWGARSIERFLRQ